IINAKISITIPRGLTASAPIRQREAVHHRDLARLAAAWRPNAPNMRLAWPLRKAPTAQLIVTSEAYKKNRSFSSRSDDFNIRRKPQHNNADENTRQSISPGRKGKKSKLIKRRIN